MLLDYVTINVPPYMNYVTTRPPLLTQIVLMDKTGLGLLVMAALTSTINIHG
jgi:hypothetical protein